jgi:hypothetical protein
MDKIAQEVVKRYERLKGDRGFNEFFKYNPDTGKLFWRVDRGQRVKAGDEAGSVSPRGYLKVKLHGRVYQTHRIAWLLIHGEWPKFEVDHINGVKTDNRLANLRVATRSANLRNAKRPVTNMSGVMGVNWHKASGKWVAQIKVHGKKQHLGLFENIDDAAAARKAAEIEHGFHPNHGRA